MNKFTSKVAGLSLAMLMGTTSLVMAQTVTIAMSPPSVETNRYWNTPGDSNQPLHRRCKVEIARHRRL